MEKGRVLLLQTALNGRPGAMMSCGGGEEGEVERVRLLSLKTALNGRPGAMTSLEGVWEGGRKGDDGKHS